MTGADVAILILVVIVLLLAIALVIVGETARKARAGQAMWQNRAGMRETELELSRVEVDQLHQQHDRLVRAQQRQLDWWKKELDSTEAERAKAVLILKQVLAPRSGLPAPLASESKGLHRSDVVIEEANPDGLLTARLRHPKVERNRKPSFPIEKDVIR